MEKMPLKVKLYTFSVIIIGIITLFAGITHISVDMVPRIIFFSLLGIVAESLIIKISGNIYISMNFAIGLAAMLIFQSPVVSIVAFLSALLWVVKEDGKWVHLLNSSIYKRIFSGSAYALSLTCATIVYHRVGTVYGITESIKFNIIGLLLAISIYTLLDIIIFSMLSAVLENKYFWMFVKENLWLALNVFGLSPLGIIIATAYMNYGWFAVLLFFGPLLIARYSFKLYMDMRHVYFETIKALSSAMEAKDKYTNGHSYRVADYAVGIAEQMGYTHDALDRIKTAAVLHDIGKIGISDSILNKPGHLEDNEYVVIQKHPEIGAKILSEVEFLGDVSKIIKYHHERFDGKGYPEGLKDAEIPMEASILAVADAYDAMTSDRPYRKAMDSHTAMNILVKESGIQFNPIVVKAFRDYLRKHGGEMAHVG
ncbi:HD-GYP domain-containing protein [Anaerosolibacter sp.]|uniref:HD-GYP domain-containing protein n=1 Tax=Anaerosolibacter sp. TaxID=1872527 RepID=UPI0039EEAD6B